jgi:transcriptional regulator with XRE-family HTH domain
MLQKDFDLLESGEVKPDDIYSPEGVEIILKHIGTWDQSGRYKRGSGKNPQHNRDFLTLRKAWKADGLTDKDIASKLGMSTREYNSRVAIAHEERRTTEMAKVKKYAARGMTDAQIATALGMSMSTARRYRLDNPLDSAKKKQTSEVADILADEVSKNPFLEIGKGTEVGIGVTRTKMDSAVQKMVDSGEYEKHKVRIKQVASDNYTTATVLTKKGVTIKDVLAHKGEIAPPTSLKVERGDATDITPLQTPNSISWDRVKIKYAIPEGKPGHGTDKDGEMMDGCMLIRPGVADMDMGKARYAQVRIAVGGTHYLKGMAVKGDAKDFPKGVDVIFNTNKTKDVPREEVLKPLKGSLKELGVAAFGAAVNKQNILKDANGNPVKTYIDINGKRKQVNKAGSLNILSEEGDWSKWSKVLSAQFLAKQRPSMVKERLDKTLKQVDNDYDEIMKVEHPYIRKKLLESYSSSLDSKQVSLKAAAPPGFRGHVILPLPGIKENEIYAPNYNNGDRVCLVRYPHAGTFEIPELRVNNNLAAGKKIIGSKSVDAIGIHPSAARKLSGADFDGDTAYVLKNNSKKWVSRPSLKELERFDPNSYADDPKQIKFKPMKKGSKYEQQQMGIVSNLITDMTLKNAPDHELVRAVKHSMVVIDAGKHKLNYKRSEKENGIDDLKRKYQTHIERVDLTKLEIPNVSRPGTKLKVTSPTELSKNKVGQKVSGAGTVISRHKKDVIFGGYDREYSDKNSRTKVTTSKGVKSYITLGLKDASVYLNPDSDIREHMYVNYINDLKKRKHIVEKDISNTHIPKKNPKAAAIFAPEVMSLKQKVANSKANSVLERQAQALANSITEQRVRELGGYDVVDKESLKKIKTMSLNTARTKTGAKRTPVKVTENEWDAIMNNAVGPTDLKEIIKYMDDKQLKELGTPRTTKVISPTKKARIKGLLDNGYTIAEVAKTMGVSTSTISKLRQEE